MHQFGRLKKLYSRLPPQAAGRYLPKRIIHYLQQRLNLPPVHLGGPLQDTGLWSLSQKLLDRFEFVSGSAEQHVSLAADYKAIH